MKFNNIHFLTSVVAILCALLSQDMMAQRKRVTGTVIEKANATPVVGAAVMVKGTTTGMSTDIDGKYALDAQEGDVIICQFFGFRTQEATVGKSDILDFSLEEDSQTLEGTIVVGYGTLKKTQLVGAVDNLSGEALEGRTNANVARSLQGQVSGLNIIQADGKPTHSGSIYIRGNSTTYHARTSATSAEGRTYSIGTGSGALVLIDGVEGDLSTLNPDDIETVAVLKDASSAAVYGARGAFGVILVTTKKPEYDKISVNYASAFAINERTVKWEDGIEDDAYTWAASYAEFFQGLNRTPTSAGSYPSTVANIQAFSTTYLEELGKRKETGYKNPVYVDGDGRFWYYGSTNWIAKFYKRRNYTQTHNISISASSKRFSYGFSARYYGQSGIYKVGHEKFFTVNLRQKAAVKITDWLTIDNNTAIARNDYDQPFYASDRPFIANVAINGAIPMFVDQNPDGSYPRMAVTNGYARLKERNAFQNETKLTVTTATGLDFNLIKDVLKLRGDYTYKAIRFERERVQPPFSYSDYLGTSTEATKQIDSYKTAWKQQTNYWAANAVATWTPRLGEHHDLNVVAGWNAENNIFDYDYVSRGGILFDGLPSFELMDGMDDSFKDYNSDYSIVGLFGRVNYSFLRRYILELSGRYDGSSKFPENHRWGFFPSASVGWRVSEEPFVKSRAGGWLDNLKLRANVGSSGNANVSPYSFMELIGVKKSSILIDGKKVSCTSDPSVVSNNLTWEKVTTYDVGIDMDILRSRLSFSGDYYIRNNDDVIIPGPELPGIYGASTPTGNFGKIQTKGWEASLAWRDQFNFKGKPFTYNMKASLWDSRTWVREYLNAAGNIYDFYKGKELGEIWGFKTAGIFKDNAEANNWIIDDFHKNGDNFREFAGDLKFRDMDGDGRIGAGSGTLSDHGDLCRIGSETPRFLFGFNMDYSWNGFGLSLFFQGVGKRDWYPDSETAFFWGQYNRAYSVLLKTQEGDNRVNIDYSTTNWTVTNADKNPYWTRPVNYSANRNVGPLTIENDHYLQNAAYVRLKNATLSYTLPESVSKKIRMQKIKIYLTGENLLTFSPLFKHTRMFDPEGIESGDSDYYSGATGLYGVGEGFAYPILRTYMLGFNIIF